MELCDDFILEYSHILRISLRSGWWRFPRLIFSHGSLIFFRLLIASVKKGHYPCPRCLIPVWKFRDMGMLRDKKYRERQERKDDLQRKHMVADARSAIYQGRYAVDGERVNRALMEQSLAPVAVGTRVQLG